jgi:hypothetical protein
MYDIINELKEGIKISGDIQKIRELTPVGLKLAVIYFESKEA